MSISPGVSWGSPSSKPPPSFGDRRRAVSRKRLKYVSYTYYLGGVLSVLNKIDAEFGVDTLRAQAEILQVKASMREKYKDHTDRTKGRMKKKKKTAKKAR